VIKKWALRRNSWTTWIERLAVSILLSSLSGTVEFDVQGLLVHLLTQAQDSLAPNKEAGSIPDHATHRRIVPALPQEFHDVVVPALVYQDAVLPNGEPLPHDLS